MSQFQALLQYLWNGLGGQMAEVSVSFKVPAQIALVVIFAALAYFGLSLCGGDEGARVYEGP